MSKVMSCSEGTGEPGAARRPAELTSNFEAMLPAITLLQVFLFSLEELLLLYDLLLSASLLLEVDTILERAVEL